MLSRPKPDPFPLLLGTLQGASAPQDRAQALSLVLKECTMWPLLTTLEQSLTCSPGPLETPSFLLAALPSIPHPSCFLRLLQSFPPLVSLSSLGTVTRLVSLYRLRVNPAQSKCRSAVWSDPSGLNPFLALYISGMTLALSLGTLRHRWNYLSHRLVRQGADGSTLERGPTGLTDKLKVGVQRTRKNYG